MVIIIVVDCIVKSAPPQNANKHFSLSLLFSGQRSKREQQ